MAKILGRSYQEGGLPWIWSDTETRHKDQRVPDTGAFSCRQKATLPDKNTQKKVERKSKSRREKKKMR